MIWKNSDIKQCKSYIAIDFYALAWQDTCISGPMHRILKIEITVWTPHASKQLEIAIYLYSYRKLYKLVSHTAVMV